jgi:TAG lipase/steryl ester hydrolase/phospholipase A2/LPA acyltransferase
LQDIKKLEMSIRENLGDITFKEAYERTKRILNITVASTNEYEMPRLLNYLTTPNVLIWSAAAASCALTFLFEPVSLMAKAPDGKIVPYNPSGMETLVFRLL